MSISVVLSFRNEEEVLLELIRRLRAVLGKDYKDNYELIFVNDVSTDHSLEILLEEVKRYKDIKIINMSRRFGHDECIIAGMKYAKGDAVIIMNTDLQDPPELIPQLIEKWLEGADVVYTVRLSRKGEHIIKVFLTKLAYRFIKAVAEVNLPVEAGDFKLISRRVVSELLKVNEKNPYLRGLVSWLGFKQVPVFYQREERTKGKTHFPFFKDFGTFHGPIGTFLSGITSFSFLPLIIFFFLGFATFLGAFFFLIFIVINEFLAIPLPKFSGFIFITLFLGGIQLLGIGIVALYLAKVYGEVRNRPNYIIESMIGFDEKK